MEAKESPMTRSSTTETASSHSYLDRSLTTIEWPQLCQYVASFAATSLGQREICNNLHPPETERAALGMIRQTRAVQLMQEEYLAEIDFGGIQTLEAEEALKRSSRGGMLNGSELLAVASLIRGSHKVSRKIRDCASQAEKEGYDAMIDGLKPISEVFTSFQVPFALATEIVGKLEESGSVKESASDDVRRASGRVRILENRLRGILKNWGETMEEHGGRMCVVLGVGASPPKGSVMVGGKLGGAVVIEPPAAVNINNDLVEAKSELKAAEDAVLWALTRSVERAEHSTENPGCLSRCLSAIVWLDGVNAKYRFGNWMSATLVTEFAQFKKTGRARGGKKGAGKVIAQGEDEAWLVMIRKLRHPLLMARYLLENRESKRSALTSKPASSSPSNNKRLPGWRKEKLSDSSSDESTAEDSLPPPVPIDILVEQGTKGVIITGPNTGGKTASLKALGLAVSMAKCGIPVPAEAPIRIPCFDAVYADIGDEQSLSASLSTFSGHLKRIEGLRKESTGKSLVLLDELGTGTDAIDGAALGIALMNAFVRDGPGGSGLTLASTHHSVLTSLKYENETNLFENASVEFDDVNLQPTYKLIWGVPGRSCALNIAERLHMDAEIVQQARAFLGRDATDVDDQLVRLEALRKREEDVQSEIRKLKSAQKRVEGSITSARFPTRTKQKRAVSTYVALIIVLISAYWHLDDGMSGDDRPRRSSWERLSWLDDSWEADGFKGPLPRYKANDRTLVTYIYSDTDGEYADNFRYFLREGIRPDDGCDYVLVIQAVKSPARSPPTEDLERVRGYDNVRVVDHENVCYDLGTLGWLYTKLEEEGMLQLYSHFVWINSSVRGPFLPPYVDSIYPPYHWTRAFTDKLDRHVKLVGSTVSCGGSGPHPPTLHVQSYAVATDAVGLELIRKNSTVLACYETMQDVVFYGERGITETILNAGYSLDSLMARYQGMDWQGQMHAIEEFGCNGDMNPIQPGFYDGTDVDPMEVMFVKVKSAFLEAMPAWPSAVRAHRLSIWKEERGDVLSASENEIIPRLEAKSEQYQRESVSRSRCFDWAFYLRANRQDPLVDEAIVDETERAAAAYEQRMLKEKESVRRSKDARAVATAVTDARRKLRGIEAAMASEEKKTGAVKDVIIEANLPSNWVPRVGDSVYVPSIQSHAVVEKVSGNGRLLSLRKGMLSMSKIGVEQVEKPR